MLIKYSHYKININSSSYSRNHIVYLVIYFVILDLVELNHCYIEKSSPLLYGHTSHIYNDINIHNL